MVILECFLVVKNLGLGIEQAWDEMLVLPLLADQAQLKALVLGLAVYNPRPCELPGLWNVLHYQFPSVFPVHPQQSVKWILDESAY